MARFSVITPIMDACYICGAKHPQIHHVFYGTANRRLSDADGFVVPLCQEHHTGRHGVHFDPAASLALKQRCQTFWEQDMGLSRDAFIRRYGRSYL